MRAASRFSRSLLLAGIGCLGFGLTGCVTAPEVARYPSWTGTRTITLTQQESGERLTVAYGRDGRYDEGAMNRVSQLMRDRHNGDVNPIDPHLLDVLVTVREQLGLAENTNFVVTSGYRSPITNASLARRSPNVAENSYHLRGQAVDFHIDGVSSQRIAEVAGDLRLGGYAWYPHTGHVHLDTGPVRTWTPRVPRRGGWVEVRSTSRRNAMAVAAVPSAKPGARSTTQAGRVTVAAKPAVLKSTAKRGTAVVAAHKPAAKVTAKSAVAHKPTAVARAAVKPAASKPARRVEVAQASPRPSRPPSR